MEKAKVNRKNLGGPVVVGKVDAELVHKLRSCGGCWREIA